MSDGGGVCLKSNIDFSIEQEGERERISLVII